MLFEEISLTPQEILDKDFKVDTRGYRPQEVEKKELIEENLRLKKELRDCKDKIELLKNTPNKELTNVDMLRRISTLEKVVFGDKNNY